MTPFNEHIRLAQAILHGHLYIEPTPPWMEHVTYGGHDYILHPPGAALLCVPFVAAGWTDQQQISWLIGAIAALLVWNLTRSVWHTAFYVCGTTFLYEAFIGASWNFALVASVPFTLLAMSLDGWMCGFCASLAALVRYDLVLAIPIYAWIRRDWRVLGGLLLWGSVYLWYNLNRFGTLTDISLNLWYQKDQYRFIASHGTFSISYLPYNLYTLLLMPPQVSRSWPWLRPQWTGQALLSLSPALLAVTPSRWLIAACVSAIPALTVYANGFSQLGCRYYTQVMPFLLMSLPRKEDLDRIAKCLILLSIALTTYFSWVALTYGLASPQ